MTAETITAPDGSITRRDSPRSDLLAFEIRDRITKPDIEWMSGIVDSAMQAQDEIDMLIVMSNYEGSDWGATMDGRAISVQARSVAHIRRYAVVGAPAFANAMIAVSGALTPVETKTFELADERMAWSWLEEGRPTKTESTPLEPTEGARDPDDQQPS